MMLVDYIVARYIIRDKTPIKDLAVRLNGRENIGVEARNRATIWQSYEEMK